ncbi:ATP-binding cassette domain-containing protein [Sediminivirga luteola]|uniref:ABC transporter ATP-binding protein n=1 Tax=Sediminivirga luteola TaxID=1774748 RepID=A0A8J2TVM2_9MICO|nr:ABC transporter ATP-binding protein [Sediminivirga luteola]MCI2265285.1 ABC transporter ATP-binding protein [Sediminivirga luteola]GGA04622.1 ABC transporter ATP-binding protein [Sediminivirga luteola]
MTPARAQAGADPVIDVANVSISYASGTRMVPVARNITFQVYPGEAIALVGESGSGKSTIARALLGSLRAGSQLVGGSVRVGGADVFALPAPELRSLRGGTVALVAQNAGHALTPSLRVSTQIAEALRAHGLDASAARITRLAELVRLGDPSLLQRYPHELSGGQQQRVAIAMALAAEPEVLVLDEPTTALDVVTQRAILDLLAELRSTLGVAVVLVSHDLGVVAEIADTVLVMRRGAEVEYGRTAQVLRAPGAEYTRTLVAAAPRLDRDAAQGPGPADPEHREPSRDGAGAGQAARPGPGPVLACRGLDVRYRRGAPLAVKGFTAEIMSGETLAVVGESGSGKSTVAQALAGLIAAENGEISFAATPSDAAEGSAPAPRSDLLKRAGRRSLQVRRAIQLVFQNADLALNPRRTVGDSIARPLRYFRVVRSRAQIAERVESLLTEVGLDGSFAGRVPAQLSGGQRQRIGIARALAAEPSLLIADEITTALDVSVQAEVLDLLRALQRRRGLSCLFISHDLAVVQRVADHVAVMKSGEIVEQGTAGQILIAPAHPYTRQLLDSTVDLSTAVKE